MFQLNTFFKIFSINFKWHIVLNFNTNIFIVLGFGGRGGGNNRGAGQQQRGGPNKFRGK